VGTFSTVEILSDTFSHTVNTDVDETAINQIKSEVIPTIRPNIVKADSSNKVVAATHFEQQPETPITIYPTYKMLWNASSIDVSANSTSYLYKDNDVFVLSKHQIDVAPISFYDVAITNSKVSITAPWSRDMDDIKVMNPTASDNAKKPVIKSGSAYTTEHAYQGYIDSVVYLIDEDYAADKNAAKAYNEQVTSELALNINTAVSSMKNNPAIYTNLFHGSSENSKFYSNYENNGITANVDEKKEHNTWKSGNVTFTPTVTVNFLGTAKSTRQTENMSKSTLHLDGITEVSLPSSYSVGKTLTRIDSSINPGMPKINEILSDTLTKRADDWDNDFDSWYYEVFDGIIEIHIKINFTGTDYKTNTAQIDLNQSDRGTKINDTAKALQDTVYNAVKTPSTHNVVNTKEGFVLGLEFPNWTWKWGKLDVPSVSWLLTPYQFQVRGSVYDTAR
jgi:hypothetical protein